MMRFAVAPANPGCVGPLDPLCGEAGGLAGGVVGPVLDAGSGFALNALGAAFVDAADSVSKAALTGLSTATRVDLDADWFRANAAVIGAVTVPVVAGLLVLQVITSVLRREPGGLARAAVGLAKAFIGAALALAVTQASLVATDGVCEYIAASAATTVEGAAARFLDLTWLSGSSGPVLQMLLGIAVIVGCLALWAVLLFRKAALLLVAVFAPIAFAGAVWDQTRVWARRWIEIVAALILCKVVVVVTFVVGASAFSGTAPTPNPYGTPGAAAASPGLSDMLVGLLLLCIAVCSPWLTFRFVHWTGMEAASVMHSTVAANPLSTAARASASQVRFTAQQAVTSSVMSGAGRAAARRPTGGPAAFGPGMPLRPGDPPGRPPAGRGPVPPRPRGGEPR